MKFSYLGPECCVINADDLCITKKEAFEFQEVPVHELVEIGDIIEFKRVKYNMNLDVAINQLACVIFTSKYFCTIRFMDNLNDYDSKNNYTTSLNRYDLNHMKYSKICTLKEIKYA